MNNADLMSNLTWKELAEIEEYLDCPMDEWASLRTKSKLAFCMQYIMAKRNNTELTMQEAEKMSITKLTELAGVEIIDAPKEVTQP